MTWTVEYSSDNDVYVLWYMYVLFWYRGEGVCANGWNIHSWTLFPKLLKAKDWCCYSHQWIFFDFWTNFYVRAWFRIHRIELVLTVWSQSVTRQILIKLLLFVSTLWTWHILLHMKKKSYFFPRLVNLYIRF